MRARLRTALAGLLTTAAVSTGVVAVTAPPAQAAPRLDTLTVCFTEARVAGMGRYGGSGGGPYTGPIAINAAQPRGQWVRMSTRAGSATGCHALTPAPGIWWSMQATHSIFNGYGWVHWDGQSRPYWPTMTGRRTVLRVTTTLWGGGTV
jgi:hypothetical protein